MSQTLGNRIQPNTFSEWYRKRYRSRFMSNEQARVKLIKICHLLIQ